MSSYLVRVTEQYRCDTENEAQELIRRAKEDPTYSITKTSNEIKTLKQKGEVVDEWRRVIIVKEFNNEKEPDSDVMPFYTDDREEVPVE